ncbi:MAG: C39 family peptidase [Bacilli bacterium]|jgi:fumarate reductase subunit D|nr:C39 family peptidase [Bacilli bacterium]
MSCNTPGMLSLFYYIKTAMNIIFIAAPILLLILGTIDFLGATTANDAKKMQKSIDNFIKRLIICVVILILPLLVNVVMSTLNVKSYKDCFTNATKANIEKLDKEYAAKLKLEAESIQKELEKAEQRAKEERERKEREERESGNNSGNSSEGNSEESNPEPYTGKPINITPGGTKSVSNALGLPYYNQCDSRWSNIVYDVGGGPNGTGATLCSSSCGYTSFAMVAAGLSRDSSVNPYSVIKHIRNIKDGQITYRGYGAASTSEITNSKYLSKYHISAQKISKSQIVNSLRQGKPVVVLVPGHYMALSIASNGNIVLLDPFTNWGNRNRRVGEYSSLSQIEAAYGGISWAAAYQRI